MEISFPKSLENILKAYIKQTFYAGSRREVFSARDFGLKDLKFFAEGAKTLSDFFTTGRSELPLNYLNDKKLRAGYLLYFFPLNFCKTQSVLNKLPEKFFLKHQYKILDLGCGPGTASLAAIDLLSKRGGADPKRISRNIEVLSLDQNYHILKDAQVLHEEWIKNLKSRDFSFRMNQLGRTFDLRRGKPDTLLKNDQFDLIIAANFLNEWNAPTLEKVKFIEKLVERHLASEGYLILMDPALHKTTRPLMELRDHLVKKRSLHLYSPCLHTKPCPMLAAEPRDWCHFYMPWQEPDFMKQLDKLLKNKNEYLKCSYMIFTPQNINELSNPALSTAQKSESYRVISNLMGSRGKSEVVLCGPAGRWHLTRLDKMASPQNRDFENLVRGDLVYAPTIPHKPFQNDGDSRIEKNDSVQKIKPLKG